MNGTGCAYSLASVYLTSYALTWASSFLSARRAS